MRYRSSKDWGAARQCLIEKLPVVEQNIKGWNANSPSYRLSARIADYPPRMIVEAEKIAGGYRDSITSPEEMQPVADFVAQLAMDLGLRAESGTGVAARGFRDSTRLEDAAMSAHVCFYTLKPDYRDFRARFAF